MCFLLLFQISKFLGRGRGWEGDVEQQKTTNKKKTPDEQNLWFTCFNWCYEDPGKSPFYCKPKVKTAPRRLVYADSHITELILKTNMKRWDQVSLAPTWRKVYLPKEGGCVQGTLELSHDKPETPFFSPLGLVKLSFIYFSVYYFLLR